MVRTPAHQDQVVEPVPLLVALRRHIPRSAGFCARMWHTSPTMVPVSVVTSWVGHSGYAHRFIDSAYSRLTVDSRGRV